MKLSKLREKYIEYGKYRLDKNDKLKKNITDNNSYKLIFFIANNDNILKYGQEKINSNNLWEKYANFILRLVQKTMPKFYSKVRKKEYKNKITIEEYIKKKRKGFFEKFNDNDLKKLEYLVFLLPDTKETKKFYNDLVFEMDKKTFNLKNLNFFQNPLKLLEKYSQAFLVIMTLTSLLVSGVVYWVLSETIGVPINMMKDINILLSIFGVSAFLIFIFTNITGIFILLISMLFFSSNINVLYLGLGILGIISFIIYLYYKKKSLYASAILLPSKIFTKIGIFFMIFLVVLFSGSLMYDTLKAHSKDKDSSLPYLLYDTYSSLYGYPKLLVEKDKKNIIVNRYILMGISNNKFQVYNLNKTFLYLDDIENISKLTQELENEIIDKKSQYGTEKKEFFRTRLSKANTHFEQLCRNLGRITITSDDREILFNLLKSSKYNKSYNIELLPSDSKIFSVMPITIENLGIKEGKYKNIQENFKDKCKIVVKNEEILKNLKTKLK